MQLYGKKQFTVCIDLFVNTENQTFHALFIIEYEICYYNILFLIKPMNWGKSRVAFTGAINKTNRNKCKNNIYANLTFTPKYELYGHK